MSTQHDAGARLPAGVSVGHWTDAQGRTGCTVLLVPGGAVGGVDVRGGAPDTIAADGLRPGTVNQRAHAILLTGGSAFGLAAAAGVLRYLEERGVGLMFGTVAVPIVAGAVQAPVDAVEAVAAQVVARAIATGVRAAQP